MNKITPFQEHFRAIYLRYKKNRLTLLECAEVLGVSYRQLLKMIKNKKSPKFHRCSLSRGKPRYYFPIDEIVWWILRNKHN